MGVAGDLASNGNSLYDWHNYWFKPLEFQNIAQTRPAFFARGNHDGEYPFSYAYSALPGNGAWFAFDYGNSRFIFLDSEASTSAVPEQYAWLVNELARPETQQAAFRVVCFHKLPYANLWNGGGYTGEGWVRNGLGAAASAIPRGRSSSTATRTTTTVGDQRRRPTSSWAAAAARWTPNASPIGRSSRSSTPATTTP